jgi:hypothetical protein
MAKRVAVLPIGFAAARVADNVESSPPTFRSTEKSSFLSSLVPPVHRGPPWYPASDLSSSPHLRIVVTHLIRQHLRRGRHTSFSLLAMFFYIGIAAAGPPSYEFWVLRGRRMWRTTHKAILAPAGKDQHLALPGGKTFSTEWNRSVDWGLHTSDADPVQSWLGRLKLYGYLR